MKFTTSTEVSRMGSRAFQIDDYKIVLHNNKVIGLVLGNEFTEALLSSGILYKLKEDLLNKKKSGHDLGDLYESSEFEEFMSLDEFNKKYSL